MKTRECTGKDAKSSSRNEIIKLRQIRDFSFRVNTSGVKIISPTAADQAGTL